MALFTTTPKLLLKKRSIPEYLEKKELVVAYTSKTFTII